MSHTGHHHHHDHQQPTHVNHGHPGNHGHHGHDKPGTNHSCVSDVPVLIQNLTWKDNEVVLDYGCGTGQTSVEQFLPIVKKHGSKLMGVDYVEKSITIAKEKYPEMAEMFYHGDVLVDSKWPLKDQKFDKIIAVHSLQYMENVKDFFTKMYQQLNDGGEIAAAVPLTPLVTLLEIMGRFPKYGKQLAENIPLLAQWSKTKDSAEWLKGLILETGFSISFWEELDVSPAHQNLDGFLETHNIRKHFGSPNVEMSEQDEEDFKKFMGKEIALMLNITDPSQPITFPRDAIRFVIKKV